MPSSPPTYLLLNPDRHEDRDLEDMTARIELMTPGDWLDVRAICEEGIAIGLGTFETVAPSWEEWNTARLPHSQFRCTGENWSEGSSNAPQDVGMHGKETKETGKKAGKKVVAVTV
jgi:hypothetical protein